MDRKEYGGYLPLELRPGREWFQVPEADIRRYNCGRTAIYEAARAMKPNVRRIHVPSYICHTVVRAIEEAGIEIVRYALNEKLEPESEPGAVGRDEGVLFVNYFGLKDEFLRRISREYTNVMLDCTQAFFFRPVMREGVYNIFSCRKFIGVPEGAYLVGRDTRADKLDPGSSWMRYGFLCKSHELGTNGAYRDSLENERELGERKEGMSELTEKVLRGVDYDFIAARRRHNFAQMRALLGDVNRLSLDAGDGVPQCYPFWAPAGTGEWLKKKLLEKRVYIPTLWKECRDICESGSLEIGWTNDLICLPVDQRYETADMEYLAGLITDLMKEGKR